jgi:hypothetical protein
MGLAVAKSATDRRPNPRGLVWIERIHIEAEVDGGVACSRDLDGLLYYSSYAMSVDLRHSENVNMMGA